MAARSLAARALRTALEALVFGDFIILSCAQAAPGSGALGAELCCLAIGATAGRLGAYLLERCGAEAAQLCARCAQRGGLGWAAQAVFRLEGVLRFSGRRGRHSGGVRLARLGAGFTTLLWLSRRACFLDLLAARIDVYV